MNVKVYIESGSDKQIRSSTLKERMDKILKESFITESIDKIDASNFKKQLQDIYDVCNYFASYIDKVIISIQQKTLKKDRSEISEIIKKGTIIVFKLRSFFTNEKLDFVIGGEIVDDEGTYNLKEKKYGQDEIFDHQNLKNLLTDFSDGAILLSARLENVKTKLEFANYTLSHYWNLIQVYGWIENYEVQAGPVNTFTAITKNSNNKLVEREYTMYQKKSKDTRVYARWRMNERNMHELYHYYYKQDEPLPKNFSQDSLDNNNFLFYNKGWLYQWLQMQYEEKEIDISEEKEYPLENFMKNENSRLENVPGIRGGDYSNKQYKFGNQQIITFQNIKDILIGGNGYHGILNSIKELLLNINNKEKLKQNLGNIYGDFTTKNDQEINDFINDSYEKIIDALQ